jgi:hypothetical protein
VPIFTLGLDLLNEESESLDPDLRQFLGVKIQEALNREQELMDEN